MHLINNFDHWRLLVNFTALLEPQRPLYHLWYHAAQSRRLLKTPLISEIIVCHGRSKLFEREYQSCLLLCLLDQAFGAEKASFGYTKGQQLWSVFSLNKKPLPSCEEAELPVTGDVLRFDLQSLSSSSRGKELYSDTGFHGFLHQEETVFMSGSLKLQKGRNGPKYACVGSTKTSNNSLKAVLETKPDCTEIGVNQGLMQGNHLISQEFVVAWQPLFLKEIPWRTETNAAFL